MVEARSQQSAACTCARYLLVLRVQLPCCRLATLAKHIALKLWHLHTENIVCVMLESSGACCVSAQTPVHELCMATAVSRCKGSTCWTLLSTLMGAPITVLMGFLWGPAHEKLGLVMPVCFRPHLQLQLQLSEGISHLSAGLRFRKQQTAAASET